EVSKAVLKHFPDFQREYAALKTQLQNLNLPGTERAERIQDSISEMLKGDASDAAARLGPEEASLYEDLKWARQVQQALKNDIGAEVAKANRYLQTVPTLPEDGPIGALQQNTEDAREKLGEVLSRENFYEHIPELQNRLTKIEHEVTATADALAAEQEALIASEKKRLESLPEWTRMDQDDQVRIAEKLDGLQKPIGSGLEGIQQYLTQHYQLS